MNPFEIKDVDQGYQIYWKTLQKPFCNHIHIIYPGNLSLLNVCEMCFEEKAKDPDFILKNDIMSGKDVEVEEPENFVFSHQVYAMPTTYENDKLKEHISKSTNKKFVFENYIHCDEGDNYSLVHKPVVFHLKSVSEKLFVVNSFYHYPYLSDEISAPDEWRKWTSNFTFEEEREIIIPSMSATDHFHTYRIDKTFIDPLSPKLNFCDMRNCPLEVFMSLHCLSRRVDVIPISKNFYEKTVLIINPSQLEHIRIYNSDIYESEDGYYLIKRKDNFLKRKIFLKMFSPHVSDIFNSPGLSTSEEHPPILYSSEIKKTRLRQTLLSINYRLRTKEFPPEDFEHYPRTDDMFTIYREFSNNWKRYYPERHPSLFLKMVYVYGDKLKDYDIECDPSVLETYKKLKDEFFTMMGEDESYPFTTLISEHAMVCNISEFLLCFFSKESKLFSEDELFVLSQEDLLNPLPQKKGFDINQVNFSIDEKDKLVYTKYLILRTVEMTGCKKIEDAKIQKLFEGRIYENLSDREQFYLENFKGK